MEWEVKLQSDKNITSLAKENKPGVQSTAEKIKEENVKAEIEKEKEKELKDKLKKSVINEDDMKVLLLVFGSRGNTTLLDKVIEKMKKQNKVI